MKPRKKTAVVSLAVAAVAVAVAAGQGTAGGALTWSGSWLPIINTSGTVKKGEWRSYKAPWLPPSKSGRYQTSQLAAGKYDFILTGTGDADLYVRVGNPPTTTLYDCRPYKSGSNETCRVLITVPARIYAAVRGVAPLSTFHLVARKVTTT